MGGVLSLVRPPLSSALRQGARSLFALLHNNHAAASGAWRIAAAAMIWMERAVLRHVMAA